MLPHDLKAFDHAFADRDARHDDDEFLEAVSLVKFEDRAEVDVGLAGAGFHLDRELQALKSVHPLNAVALLDGAHIREKLRVVEHEVIANSVLRERHPAGHGRTDLKGRLTERLAVKHVGDRADGV